MNTNTGARALVLFSGGQDSTTCLAWAIARYERVETVAFDYGQRHAVELQCRHAVLAAMRTLNPAWAEGLGQDHLLDLSVLSQVGDTALTREKEIAMRADGMPNTFVPGRNLLFLTLAAALAYRRGIAVLVGGMCQTDYSGYPDCRDSTIKALQEALRLGLASPVEIETPLMWIDKAQTWQLAQDLGGRDFIDLIIRETHTCYLGQRDQFHSWGYGCGSCPACALRRDGYAKFSAGGIHS